MISLLGPSIGISSCKLCVGYVINWDVGVYFRGVICPHLPSSTKLTVHRLCGLYEMRVLNRLQFAFLLLLCPPQLNCSTSWQPPRQGLASPLPWQRRLITVTKTSRDALHYGLLWKSWTHVHNKTYSTSNEGLERYVVWRSNTAYIQYHNTYADKFGFTMAMNSFGDQVCRFRCH